MFSTILGVLATVAAVLGFQLKKQGQIILSQCIANLLVASSYLVLDLSKMAGGALCLVGAVQTFINYLYYRKEKAPKKWLVLIFFIINIVISILLIAFSEAPNLPYDLMPLLGSAFFVVGVSVKEARTTRAFFFFNTLVWLLYDVLATPVAVGNLITHSAIMISVILGIIRYDILKRGEEND